MAKIDNFISSFLVALQCEDRSFYLEAQEQVNERALWKQVFSELHLISNINNAHKELFHNNITACGHRIREQVDDDNLYIESIKRILIPYTGNSLKLYRGDNLKRYQDGACGFFWSTSFEVARMFARGLNSIPDGGILLSADVPSNLILTGTSEHSQALKEYEYIVDSRGLRNIIEVARYPEVD